MKKSDLPLLREWFDSEHIYRWFGDPEFWLLEFEYEPNSSFMLEYEGESIGFCRYTTQIPSEFQSFFPHILCQIPAKNLMVHKQNQGVTIDNQHDSSYLATLPLYFVDYGIGNQSYLGKGFAKKMLALLCNSVASEKACVFVAASSLKNASSCSILRWNDFHYNEEANLFLKIMA